MIFRKINKLSEFDYLCLFLWSFTSLKYLCDGNGRVVTGVNRIRLMRGAVISQEREVSAGQVRFTQYKGWVKRLA